MQPGARSLHKQHQPSQRRQHCCIAHDKASLWQFAAPSGTPGSHPLQQHRGDVTGRQQTVLTQEALSTHRCKAAKLTPLPASAAAHPTPCLSAQPACSSEHCQGQPTEGLRYTALAPAPCASREQISSEDLSPGPHQSHRQAWTPHAEGPPEPAPQQRRLWGPWAHWTQTESPAECSRPAQTGSNSETLGVHQGDDIVGSQARQHTKAAAERPSQDHACTPESEAAHRPQHH